MRKFFVFYFLNHPLPPFRACERFLWNSPWRVSCFRYTRIHILIYYYAAILCALHVHHIMLVRVVGCTLHLPTTTSTPIIPVQTNGVRRLINWCTYCVFAGRSRSHRLTSRVRRRWFGVRIMQDIYR